MKYIITAKNTDRNYISVHLPPSKSISNRALILRALSGSDLNIKNLSDCDDTNVLINALNSEGGLIDVKAAGTAMRFLTGYFSCKPNNEYIITGTDRMLERPIHILVDALISLGANIEYISKIGYPPLKIRGKNIDGGEIYVSTEISSQFISSLLMIAPSMKSGLTIHLEGKMISLPYIKLTLSMMAQYGVMANWDQSIIKIQPTNYEPISFNIESDWSAASYWYQIAALLTDNTTIQLQGLSQNSIQGDSKIADLFVDFGIYTEYTINGIALTKKNKYAKKIFHDFTNEPDLTQTFVVTCCMLDIAFLFTGLDSLRIKETNRIDALKQELKKLGFLLQTNYSETILEWNGEKCKAEINPTIETYEDHRMAMAFAPIALKLGTITINNPSVVTKSYPNYWKDLEHTGFIINQA